MEQEQEKLNPETHKKKTKSFVFFIMYIFILNLILNILRHFQVAFLFSLIKQRNFFLQ